MLAADGLVVRDVGAYAACMAGIEAIDGRSIVADFLASGRHQLGICVGVQLLLDSGDEHRVYTEGLGSPARCRRSRRRSCRTWAGTRWPVHASPGLSPAWRRAPASTSCTPTQHARRLGWSPTAEPPGKPFVAAVEFGQVSATQFHPGRSGDAVHCCCATGSIPVTSPSPHAHVRRIVGFRPLKR